MVTRTTYNDKLTWSGDTGEMLTGRLRNPGQEPLASSNLRDHELETQSGALEITPATQKHLS